jgi:hypothetical protein
LKGLTKGDRIQHALYGTGTVTDVSDQHTVIAFDAEGVRKFVSSIAVFERTEVVAPASASKSRKKAAAVARPKSR